MKLGEIIKKYRQEHEMSLRDFAQKCGTSHSYISMLEDGKNSKTGEPMTPTLATLKKISSALEISLNELMIKADDMPVKIEPHPSPFISYRSTQSQESIYENNGVGVRIPVFGSVAAGIPIEAITDIEDYEEISQDLARTGEFAALRIKGDSMEPKFSAGDVVIVRLQESADNGDIAIVLVNGDEATCKKIKRMPEGIMLISTNPAYEPMFYSNHDIQEKPVRIWGKVIELRAKF